MGKQDQVQTGVVLANATELISEVICEIAGDDIATQLQGEDIYGSALQDTVAVKLQSVLTPKIG